MSQRFSKKIRIGIGDLLSTNQNIATLNPIAGIVLLFVISLSSPLWAVSTSYYLSPTGSDSAAGTIGAPFLTITKARDSIRSAKIGGNTGPFTVYLRGGIYYITSTIQFETQDSGTASAPVVYTNYSGETPELVGGRLLTGFQTSGNMVTKTVPNNPAFKSLFVDGKRQPRARFPNYDENNPYRGGFKYTANSNNSTTVFYYAPGDISLTSPTGVEVHIFPGGVAGSFMEITSLTTIDKTNNKITISGSEATYGIKTGDRYFIENSIELLDAPGEWFLNTATGLLTYYSSSGFSSQSEVIAPSVTRLLEFAGTTSYLQLNGLTFRGTDFSHSDGCDGFSMCYSGVITYENAVGCVIQNCKFSNIGRNAVYIGSGRNNKITKNTIRDSAEGGIHIYNTSNSEVSYNSIQDCGLVYKHVAAIVLSDSATSGNSISHNDINNITRYGISLKGPGSNNVIEYNRIQNTSTETYDTGGIEVTQHDPSFNSGSIIRNNIVADTIGYSSIAGTPDYLSWGIYLDSYAGGYSVYNNIVYRNSSGGVMIQGGKNNSIRNNVLANSSGANMWITNYNSNSTGNIVEKNIIYLSNVNVWAIYTETLGASTISFDNNLYYCPGHTKSEIIIKSPGMGTVAKWQSAGYDVHSLFVDPLFVNPSNYDYTLQAGSQAFSLGFQQIDTSSIGTGQQTVLQPPARIFIQ